MLIRTSEAISDPNLLGAGFTGPSWARWKAILRAAEGQPLNDSERALFAEVSGNRQPPRKRVKELWIKAGRRAGKDSIASAIAATAAMIDYRKYLRPGERASILCLACDKEQAQIVYRYICAYYNDNPLLRPRVVRQTGDGTLELSNNVEVIVATANFRSLRGRTIAAVILDELAYWRSDDAAYPDNEAYVALLPALATLPTSMLIAISTGYRKSGLLFEKWTQHYGKSDDDVLVVGGTSRQFNPTLDQRIIDKAIADDAESAEAEWMGGWRSDISDFLDRAIVMAAVDEGIAARPPVASHRYIAFTDPSGGRGDSFTLAIAHAEGNVIFLDALIERRSPFEPTPVVNEVATLLKSYGLSEVTGDAYAAAWVSEAFAKEGITYLKSERVRSQVYADVQPLFTSGRLRLIDHRRTINQFIALERRTSRLGRDAINHPVGGSDDCANSAAGAATLAASEAAPLLFRRSDLLSSNAPVPLPERIALVAASASVDAKGCAFFIWARNLHNLPGIPPLLLIDFNVNVPPDFLTLKEQLATLALQMRAYDAGLYTISTLVHHAARVDLPSAAMDHILVHRDQLALAVSAELGKGTVKLATPAFEKAQSHPLPFAFTEPSAANDAMLLGIGCALLPQEALARAA